MCVVQLYILDNKKYNHISTKKLLLTFYSGFSSVTQVQSIFNEKQPNVFKRTIRMLFTFDSDQCSIHSLFLHRVLSLIF